MVVAKVLGIETEYGITGGPDRDPILASSIIVNAYAQEGRTTTNWDFGAESPSSDARSVPDLTAFAPLVETHLANTVLTNGARLYVDHAHPEYSSPECVSPLQAVLYDVAGEFVMLRALRVANGLLPSTSQIQIYKNNSDGKGNSYGTHENFLVERTVEFADIVRAMVPHFVSRQIITGAGKVGYETDVLSDLRPRFQISQRAEFFEEIVGLETTLKRPIVNSRDEPHADPDRFRRLHVINGDASMSQVATLVKIGSTALLLGALESFGVGAFPTSPRFPVHAIRHYSCDLSLKSPVEDMDGRLLTAWDYQDQLWQLAARFHDSGASDSVASPDEVVLILRHWRELLDGVRDAPDTVSDRIDWLAKKRLVDGYQERFATVDTDPRLKVIDVQYHDVRPEKSLSRRAGLFALFPAEDVATAVTIAPTTTRAYARGECVRRFGSSVVAANWDSLVLEDSRGLLHRIPMLNPLQGTRELAGQYFAGDPSVDEFVQRVEKGL